MTTRRVPRCSNCGAATLKKPRFTDAPSPFRDLIAVNGAASGPELIHYLQGVHADILAQDETIRRVKVALEDAISEKDRLQRIADSHVGLMSAFRSFPPEVLAQIFHLAAVSRPNEQPKHITQVFNALWKIGAVCRLWRSIVLSNPSLWACFSFSTGDVLSTKLETVLDRSREAGLSIAFQESPFFFPQWDCLERVLSTCHRWRRVWIQTSATNACPYAQIRDQLPLLEQLSLSADYDTFPWDSFLAFENAPRLREVVLGHGISPECNRLALPWSQITSLHMNHAVEAADVRAVLSMTPNLRCLSFRPYKYKRINDWEPKSKEDIVKCTSLQSLNVHDAAFLRTVTFPAVEEIDLEIYHAFYDVKDKNAWVDIFHDFLGRSGSPVKTLRLEIGEPCPDYGKLLNNAFRLTHLDITVSSLSTATALFRVLALNGDKTNVLPQLQYLKATVAEVTQPHTFVEEINLGENIVDMLVSRYRVPSSSMTEIQSAYIDLPCLPTLFWMHLRTRVSDAPGLQNLISTTSDNGRFVISMGRVARRATKAP
ncbi:hypothetical protein IW261DRAFT_1560387 [Armillaria novae-zelandiae]|uniref:F-box domain-containing protein n=1 Tax=Armillaria novae-zelandiae TaxID=153914 RepID=A0AA39PII6_9AGAR|nr:hypothetical protein IW261DRAFT_1560387 [Armillaria novae-zelandiae]